LDDVVAQQLESREQIPANQNSLYTEMKNKQYSMFGIKDKDDIFGLHEKKRKSVDEKDKNTYHKKLKVEKLKEDRDMKKRREDDYEYVPDLDHPRVHTNTQTVVTGAGEVFNLHCHHCKKRRPRCAICPYNTTHRYCQNCVTRHFGVEYELLALDTLKFWKDGCPKCTGQCPCAICRVANGIQPKDPSNSPKKERIKKKKKDDFFFFSQMIQNKNYYFLKNKWKKKFP